MDSTLTSLLPTPLALAFAKLRRSESDIASHFAFVEGPVLLYMAAVLRSQLRKSDLPAERISMGQRVGEIRHLVAEICQSGEVPLLDPFAGSSSRDRLNHLVRSRNAWAHGRSGKLDIVELHALVSDILESVSWGLLLLGDAATVDTSHVAFEVLRGIEGQMAPPVTYLDREVIGPLETTSMLFFLRLPSGGTIEAADFVPLASHLTLKRGRHGENEVHARLQTVGGSRYLDLAEFIQSEPNAISEAPPDVKRFPPPLQVSIGVETTSSIVSMPFVVDTGAAVSTIPISLAEAAGIHFDYSHSKTIRGSSGAPTQGYYGGITIHVGPVAIRIPCMFVESHKTKSRATLGRAGILEHFTLAFDEHQIRIYQKGMEEFDSQPLATGHAVIT